MTAAYHMEGDPYKQLEEAQNQRSGDFIGKNKYCIFYFFILLTKTYCIVFVLD